MSKNKKQVEKINNARNQLVVQSNDFIRHARNKLLPQEQNIVYFLISKVKPKDKDFMTVTFTVEEFCNLCGMDSSSGKNYSDIKNALKSVADKSAWTEYRDEEGRCVGTLVRWVDTYKFYEDSGVLTATLSQSIKPFLLGLVDNGFYTQAELITFLALKSKYSKRLYELLKSYLDISEAKRYKLTIKKFEITELKQLVAAENYDKFKDFRSRVLDIAMREINEITDIEASYSTTKTGRKYTGIEFLIKYKKPTERFSAHATAEKVLDKG